MNNQLHHSRPSSSNSTARPDSKKSRLIAVQKTKADLADREYGSNTYSFSFATTSNQPLTLDQVKDIFSSPLKSIVIRDELFISMYGDHEEHWFRVDSSKNFKVIFHETISASNHDDNWRKLNAACLIKYMESKREINKHMAPPKQCVMLKKHGESKSVRNKRQKRTAEIRELIHSVEAIDRFSQWCMNTLADIALDAQANAESARHIALEAQATADSANDNALEAQATADSANDIALDAQANAESANDIALDAQAAADSANDIALDAQATAESARDIALDAQATADSLEIDLCELEKDVDVHNSKITELESDVQDIHKRVTELEDKLLAVEKSLQDRCKFCESSIQLLRKDVTGVCSALCNISSSNVDLAEMVNELKGVLSNLHSKNSKIEV